VKIAEGCRNRCSYCAIPLIRGDLRSREIAGLRREVEDLLVKGVFEIVLIAQDLASFGLDRGSPGELIPLLEELSAVPGDFWLRLLYIHPDNFPFELLDLCGKDAAGSFPISTFRSRARIRSDPRADEQRGR
jgi:ribosomal protein S12 methylthiotransferase